MTLELRTRHPKCSEDYGCKAMHGKVRTLCGPSGWTDGSLSVSLRRPGSKPANFNLNSLALSFNYVSFKKAEEKSFCLSPQRPPRTRGTKLTHRSTPDTTAGLYHQGCTTGSYALPQSQQHAHKIECDRPWRMGSDVVPRCDTMNRPLPSSVKAKPQQDSSESSKGSPEGGGRVESQYTRTPDLPSQGLSNPRMDADSSATASERDSTLHATAGVDCEQHLDSPPSQESARMDDERKPAAVDGTGRARGSPHNDVHPRRSTWTEDDETILMGHSYRTLLSQDIPDFVRQHSTTLTFPQKVRNRHRRCMVFVRSPMAHWPISQHSPSIMFS